jgi:hypothetical protein
MAEIDALVTFFQSFAIIRVLSSEMVGHHLAYFMISEFTKSLLKPRMSVFLSLN